MGKIECFPQSFSWKSRSLFGNFFPENQYLLRKKFEKFPGKMHDAQRLVIFWSDLYFLEGHEIFFIFSSSWKCQNKRTFFWNLSNVFPKNIDFFRKILPDKILQKWKIWGKSSIFSHKYFFLREKVWKKF